MNIERIQEIHEDTAHPKSQSVADALLKVWNETRQEANEALVSAEIRARAEGERTGYLKGREEMRGILVAEHRVECTDCRQANYEAIYSDGYLKGIERAALIADDHDDLVWKVKFGDAAKDIARDIRAASALPATDHPADDLTMVPATERVGEMCEWTFREYGWSETLWYGTGCGCLERKTTGPFCQCCGKPISLQSREGV